jgi:hypothetical protein
MSSQGSTSFAYLFPAVALVAVVLYFAYGAIDRLGLAAHDTEAQVTGKQYAAGSTTYTTEVIGGRTMTKANKNPEAFIVTLRVGNEETGSAVSKPLYESLQAGERVRVRVRRTRLSKRLLVTDVTR